MRTSAFTLSTDGSNDDKSKQYPIVIRSVNVDTGVVNSELLSIPICEESATGENIFKLLEAELASRDVPWTNCLAVGCDNAPVMTGGNKGVIAFVRKKHPNVFMAGCCLHLVHIAAEKGAVCLPGVEDVLVDIFHYFKKSAKRQCEFANMQELFDVEQKRMLKHVCTRWLSIGRCLTRLLHNWVALKAFFKAEKETHDKKTKKSDDAEKPYAARTVDSVHTFLKSPTNKLYVLFLEYTVKVFDDVLVNLQSDEPKIHVLRQSLLKVLRNLLVRFVKPAAIRGVSLVDVNFKSPYNLKNDSELVIGDAARAFIADATNNGLREKRVKAFHGDVKKYFTAVCSYMIAKLPLNEPLLRHVEVVDVRGQMTAQLSDVTYFTTKCPALLRGASVDTVTEQFSLYQSMDVTECIKPRLDETWSAIGHITDEDGSHPLKELSFVMLGLLAIPHSSSHCERVFSTVRKNRTDQRASLADDTLEAMLVLKSQPGHPIDSARQHSEARLGELKHAYYKANKPSASS